MTPFNRFARNSAPDTQPLRVDVRACTGINTFNHETEIQDTQSTVLKNSDIAIFGKIRKRLGSNLVLNDPGGNAVVVLNYFNAPSVDERMVMITGLRIYDSTSPLATAGSWTDIEGSDGFTADTYTTAMVIADDKLFVSNGTENVHYHNGSGITDAGSGSTNPPKGKVLAYFKNRLWVANVGTNPEWVYYSDALDTLTGFNTSTQIFKVESGSATEVMAMVTLGDSLIIFKEDSVHELVVAGATAAYWTLRPIKKRYGCVSFDCAKENGGIIYYMSNSGVRTLGGKYDEIPMSRLVKTTWDTINWDYIVRSRMVIHDNKVYVAVPTGSSTYADTVLIWDVLLEQWDIITGWNVGSWGIYRELTAGNTSAYEEVLMYGDAADGKVYHCFKSTQFTDAGTAVDLDWQTKAFDFGDPELYKAGGKIVLRMITDGGALPISQWTMNDNAASATVTDSQGNYNGTLKDDGGDINTDTVSTTGKISTALSLDGGQLRIDCGDVTQLNSATTFSLCGWFKQDIPNVQDFFWRKYLDNNNQLSFYTDVDGALYILIRVAGVSYAGKILNYLKVITVNTFFHLAITIDFSQSTDADRMQIYVNGVSMALTFTGTVQSALADMATANFFIGDSEGVQTFDGAVDDVRLYDFALTSAQVTDIYNSGSGTETANIISKTTVYADADASGSWTLLNSVNGTTTFHLEPLGEFKNAKFRIRQNGLNGSQTEINGFTAETYPVGYRGE